MLGRPASFLSLAAVLARQTYAQCLSYGIDIVDGGSYFINTNSNETFSSVTQFSGCNNDVANIIVSGPNGIETYCQDIPLQPDFTSELSQCPDLQKSSMVSGEYEMTIISNNADGEPFGNQRDFYISAGPQATATATATMVFNFTTTPTVTATTTTFVSSIVTFNNTLTITVPSATDFVTKYPRPTTVYPTTTLTRTLKTWTRTSVVVTSTETATCTVPPRPWRPDPTWHRKPQVLIEVPTGLAVPDSSTNQRRAADFAIRDAMRSERRSARLADEIEGRQLDKRNMAKRSVDVATTTITQTTSTATSTSTFYAPTSTVPEITVLTTTLSTTLPPSTIVYGVAESTVTAPQQTRTRLEVTTSYVWTTKTMTASFTEWSTVTPTASVTACRRQGGHFGGGGWW